MQVIFFLFRFTIQLDSYIREQLEKIRAKIISVTNEAISAKESIFFWHNKQILNQKNELVK